MSACLNAEVMMPSKEKEVNHSIEFNNSVVAKSKTDTATHTSYMDVRPAKAISSEEAVAILEPEIEKGKKIVAKLRATLEAV